MNIVNTSSFLLRRSWVWTCIIESLYNDRTALHKGFKMLFTLRKPIILKFVNFSQRRICTFPYFVDSFFFLQRILIIFCYQIFLVELVHEFYLNFVVVGLCILDMDFRFLISRNISCCSSHISIFNIKFATRYSITYNHQWQNSIW